jgi:hypothetical protein
LFRAVRFPLLLACGTAVQLLALAGSARSAPGPSPSRVPVAEVLRPPAWVQWSPEGRASIQPTEVDLLLRRLEESDRGWLPRTRRLPDGRVQVTMQRLPGDPPLSQSEVEAMLRNPPRWEKERATIRALLTRLRQVGVTVAFETLVAPEATGQWDPRRRRLSLSPDLPDRGSRLFARVLNHEAIHVAQSCAAGGLRELPTPLGLPGRPSTAERQLLSQPIYLNQSPAVQAVESEVFAHQNDLSLGLSLLDRHCRASGAQPGRLAP